MRKLELDSLQAELSTLDALLARRTEKEDPLGWLQLTPRRADVAARLARMESDLPANAEVAVFFGGTPVVGSRGIRADFATDAISHYQELVTKRLASQALGPLATRGPVPRRDISTMLVTDVVRGSFGFVLQENGESSEPTMAASLRQTLADVSKLLANIAAEDPAAFEEAAETLDDRTLFAIRDLLRVLDDNGATLRLIEGDRDLSFDSRSLHRGRERADATVIDETVIRREGVLFLVPDARRFELHPTAGPVLKGIVAPNVIQRNGQDEHPGAFDAADIVGKRWLVELHEKTVKQGSGKSRASYTLLRFIEIQ